MKFALPTRRKRGVYTVTDARRSMSEDISYRQRRYLISMGVRVVAFLLAVFLFHGVWRFIAAAIALVVPYFAVVFANGGREPDNSAFEPFEPNLPQRSGTDAAPPGPAADDSAAEHTTANNTRSNSTALGNGPHSSTPGNSGAHGNTAHDATYDKTAHDNATDTSGAHTTGMREHVMPGPRTPQHGSREQVPDSLECRRARASRTR